MQWFASNWTRNNWFANNWFAGQPVSDQQPAGGWFGYPLGAKRRRSEEDERAEQDDVALADALPEVQKAVRKVTRADIDAARKWADGIGRGQTAINLPAMQSFEVAFAFPADRRLSDDEAVALVLMLSEV